MKQIGKPFDYHRALASHLGTDQSVVSRNLNKSRPYESKLYGKVLSKVTLFNHPF